MNVTYKDKNGNVIKKTTSNTLEEFRNGGIIEVNGVKHKVVSNKSKMYSNYNANSGFGSICVDIDATTEPVKTKSGILSVVLVVIIIASCMAASILLFGLMN